MYSKAFTILLGVMSFFSFGCDDNSNENTGGNSVASTQETLTSMCQEECARQKKCESSVSTTCESDCKTNNSGIVGQMRLDFAQEQITCIKQNSDCTQQSSCPQLEDIFNKLTPGYKESELYKSCVSKRDECTKAKQTTFHDDYCTVVFSLIDSLKSKMGECIKKSCEEAKTCADPIFENID